MPNLISVLRTKLPASVLLYAIVAPVYAANWRLQPNFGLSELYTDNIQAAPAGQEESEFITNLNSGLSLSGDGRRVKINANYNAQRSFYMEDSRRNDLTHFLSSNLRTEFIRDIFFVDAFASMSPTTAFNNGRITNRNIIDVGGNRADVLTYGVTPRGNYRFGNWATGTVSKSFSDTTTGSQDGTGGNFAGSGNNGNLNMSLNSGRRFTRFTWGISMSERDFQADRDNEESKLRSTTINLGYRLHRKLRIFGTIGDEANDFRGDQNLDDGGTWSVGATFTPTPRTSLTGSYGNRSFGSTKNFSFSHRLRRMSIRGSYSEELSTTSEQLQRQQLFRNEDIFGNPVATPFNPLDLNNPVFPATNLTLTDDVFVSRNFTSNIGYRYRLNDFSLGVSRQEQETPRTGGIEDGLGVNFNWSRQMSDLLSSSLSFSFQDRSGDSQGSLQAIFVTPSLSYRLGPNISTRLSYSYAENISDGGTNDYVENSVTGTLNYAF